MELSRATNAPGAQVVTGHCRCSAGVASTLARVSRLLAIGMLTANILAALGGCWWPIEVTPDWVQALQKAVPPGWAMDALHKLISFRAGAASALPHVLVLLIAAYVVGRLAARRLRYE